MKIELPANQKQWLEAQIAAGHFTSIDEALALAVADMMAVETDDLAWAKPYIDEARASVARGGVIPGDEFLKQLDDKIASLQSK